MRTLIVLSAVLVALMGVMRTQAGVLAEGPQPVATDSRAPHPTPTPTPAPKSTPTAEQTPTPTATATPKSTPTAEQTSKPAGTSGAADKPTPSPTPTPTKCAILASDGQPLCNLTRKKAKEYYREAYRMFAKPLDQVDGRFVNQVYTNGVAQFQKGPDGKPDPNRPVISTDQKVPLDSGWPTDPNLIPVFLTEDEASVTPSWQDYNRLTFSATFLPAGSGATRSFILVQSKIWRSSYFSYAPAADDQSYDLTKPPIKRRLTRAQEERYWADLPSTGKAFDLSDKKRWTAALGVSPDGFQLGSTTATKTDAGKATYLIGAAFSLNPYASLHLGEATSDGRHFRPALGFGLDVDIISKIFGGTK